MMPAGLDALDFRACDGSGLCQAALHWHGCFRDLDGSACDEPEGHPVPDVSGSER